jgi:hypothetical protein
MKLTVEDNRETIKRYAHLKPAPAWGSNRCGAACPGSPRTCTLEGGHRGPHVAHGLFRRVVAVWDSGARTRTSDDRSKGLVRAASRNDAAQGGLVAALRTFRAVVPSMETGIYLFFFLIMVGFGLYFVLLILGGPL